MKTIYKHPVTEKFHVDMTAEGKVVHVENQDGKPMMWFEVTGHTTTLKRRHFEVFGTGHQIPDDAIYIGTWQGPPYVWHLYEVTK